MASLTGPVLCCGAFHRVEILLPRINYTYEIADTQRGALLPERAPVANPSCVSAFSPPTQA